MWNKRVQIDMFREKIKKTIYDRGLKIKQVANEVGMNQASLYAYLKGDRNISFKHLDNLIHYIGLYLLPKEGFEFDKDKVPKMLK